MDRERIAAKIREMDSYLNKLKAFAPPKLENYLGDEKTKHACERLLQISIETAIEIASEISKGLKIEIPADEEDMFEKLKKKRVISERLADKLKEMKGFRNILVHRYGEVNDRLVFAFIENDLSDFEDLKKEILFFLKQRTFHRIDTVV